MGIVILGIQLILLGWWSSVLVSRFAITTDFGAYQQAAYLIAHGNLNPYSTVLLMQFWRNDTELLIWPLAMFVRIWPHLTALPWLQDIALVAAELVALNWMCDIAAARAQREGETRMSTALVVLGIVLLVGNPWTAWTASFDVHLEPFVTLFTLCAARDIYRGQRRAWVWVLLALTCGSVGASYLVGLGISAALVGRRWLRQGAAVTVVGIGWILFIQAIHGAEASGVLEYSQLATGRWGGRFPRGLSGSAVATRALTHPARVITALWRNKLNVWANLSPGGVIGLAWLPLAVPCVLILLEGALSSPVFSRPGFQSIALATFVALGTIALLAAMPIGGRRRRMWGLAGIMILLCVNAVGWSVVWLTQVSKTWELVDSHASAVLKDARMKMAPNDEVVVSPGVIGGFANRRYVYRLTPNARRIPIKSRTTWIVITPTQGIEASQIHGYYTQIRLLNHTPGVTLLSASNGVWVYKLTAARGQHQLNLGLKASDTSQPAWTLVGTAGRRVTTGPPSQWYAESTGEPGYVISQSYWREPKGVYRASAKLSVAGNANLELWDIDTGKLLGRTIVHNTHGVHQVSVVGHLLTAPPAKVTTGWGPWSYTPIVPDGDSLEIRVWNSGGRNRVRVYSVALQALSETPSGG